ncbi:RIO kinase 2 [Geosmithia morbida]|uniref:Serine/threonine-protein kinase RIO2 n=1 Tax=Geosmithia morbida TaxID=1094350 RepID=A0A9P4Z3J9_9HYPO|nr:RIO kinase 2 [Geosmithia morbida]KAF4126598.1 RIO kinase 2 [Geosmithia morbida]
MKLDTRAMRHLASEDWRVLTAVEMGSKNHEIVPTPLIEKLSRLRGGASGVHRSISALAKVGLIARVKEAKYDGYRLTYGGLDYLALHTHSSRKDVYSVGSRIGVGKESDIMVVSDEKGVQHVLKIHRLGRISFRSVKSNRDYLKNRQSASWMYLSRLAAMKEFAFMKALEEAGFPVPHPIGQSRHTIVMALIDAFPLRQISDVPDPASLYADLIGLILRLAKHGLIHGDFNEFNILVKEIETTSEKDDGSQEASVRLEPVLIDFPQMVSMEHQNAEMYFDRDVECIKRFFYRRFGFTSTEPGPFFKDAKKTVGKDDTPRLDAAVEASGFTKKMLKDLEAAIKDRGPKEEEGTHSDGDYDDDEDKDEAVASEEAAHGQQEEDVSPEVQDDDASPHQGNTLDDPSNKSEELKKGMDKLAL